MFLFLLPLPPVQLKKNRSTFNEPTIGRLDKNFISQQLSGWLKAVFPFLGGLYLFVFVDFSRFCIWIRLARPQPWQLGAEAAGRPCLWPHHHRIQYHQPDERWNRAQYRHIQYGMETPSIVFDLDACAPDAGEEHQSTSFWDPWSHKRAFGSNISQMRIFLGKKKPLTRVMPWIITDLTWNDMTWHRLNILHTYFQRNIITATIPNPLPANLIMGGRRNSPWEVSPLPLGLPLKSWVGSWLMAAPPPQMPPLLSSMPLFTQVMAIPWRNSTPGTNFRDFFKQPLGAQGKRKIVIPSPTMFSLEA